METSCNWSALPTHAYVLDITHAALNCSSDGYQYDTDRGIEAVALYLQSCKDALLEESIDDITDDLLRLSVTEAMRFDAVRSAGKSPVCLAIKISEAWSKHILGFRGFACSEHQSC